MGNFMTMKLKNYPILKILIPYVFGIFIAYFGNFSLQNGYFFAAIIFGLLLFSYLFLRFLRYKWQWIAEILLLFSFVLVGFWLTNFHFAPKFSSETQEYIETNRNWLVKIIDAPIEKEKSFKLTVDILNSLEERQIGERAIVYIKKDSVSSLLQFGDVLLVNTQFSRIEPPRNPNSFDNQKFLQRKGIFFTGYVGATHWKSVRCEKSLSVKNEAHKIQQFFARQFARSGLRGDEYAIITAILLGSDDTMEPELKAQYATAGVSHILCVSGMHVGIIFMILNFLLKPLDFSRRTRLLKALLLLLCIWFYANMTGLSPSVKRAATMFTFVTVGSMLRRNTTIFHSLYASLFCLLLLNPLLIFEVGLQLSYAAVFGIVIFQKRFVQLLKPKTRLGNYFWELASVSVAAQLATFPISVYYFGQFPNYFIISNLSVIFLSFLIVISGVVVLATSFSTWLSTILGFVLSYEIKAMNAIIKFVDSLPGALTDNISFSAPQVIILYLVIAALFAYFVQRRKRYFFAGLSLFATFVLIFDVHKWSAAHREELIVYSVPRMSALSFNTFGNAVLLSDSIQSPSHTQYKFCIENDARAKKTDNQFVTFSEQQTLYRQSLFKSGNFLYFKGQKFYILKKGQKLYATNNKMKVNYLLLSNSPSLSPEKVGAALDFDFVIIDESNSIYCENRWIEFCEKAHIPYHSTRQLGFFKM